MPDLTPEVTVGLIRWTGFDDAIIGQVTRPDLSPCFVYDREVLEKILMDRDQMSYDDAREYVDYNIAGAYVGPTTPFLLSRGDFPSDDAP